MASNSQAGYSASVRLELWINDVAHELAEIGPTWVYLREPLSLPPCAGEVVMTVDGHRETWPVALPNGCSPDSPTVTTTRLKSASKVEALAVANEA